MKKRIELDKYYTEEKLTQVLLNNYEINKNKTILECCSGENYIANYFKNLNYKVITNDIDKNCLTDYHYDFSLFDVDYKYKLSNKCDIVITNPPFNLANKILENSLDICDEVCFLLRLTFLEPTRDRNDLMTKYEDNLKRLVVVNPKPKFRSDYKGTDSVTVAWFIWDKNFSWDRLGIERPFKFINNWNK